MFRQQLPSWFEQELKVKIFPHKDDRAPHRKDKIPFYVKLISQEPIEIFFQNKSICKSKEIRINTKKYYNKKIYCVDEKRTIIFPQNSKNHYILKSEDPIQVIRAGHENNYFYRGKIEFIPYRWSIELVNIIDMESYLEGVVSAEVFLTWPQETLSAQIVASRTYAYYRLFLKQRCKQVRCGQSYDFDDTIDYQAYVGDYLEYKKYLEKILKERLAKIPKDSEKYKQVQEQLSKVRGTIEVFPILLGALMITRGQIMVLEDFPDFQIFQAYFHAASGGYTVDAKDVNFSGCSPCKEVLDYTLEDIEADEFAKKNLKSAEFWIRHENIVRIEKFLKISRLIKEFDTVVRILTDGEYSKRPYRSESGHHLIVPIMLVNGDIKKIFGSRFILSLHLPSTKYYLTGKEGKYTFKGRGYGHGVGLSQWGAYFKAKKGWKYEDILKYYYNGIKIVTLE